jgi:drug/metabolite transporter (DMT)-like permease
MSERPFGNEAFGARSTLLVVFLCFLWGGLTPSLKLSLTGMPPLAVAGWRFLIGLVAIWIWSRWNGINLYVPRKAQLPLFLYSLVFVAQISSVNFGTRLTTSNFAIILINTSPLFVALLAHFLIPNDRLTVRKALGLAVAFLGVAVIFVASVPETDQLRGNFLVLLGGFLLGVIHVYGKFLLRRFSAFQVVFWEFVYGITFFFALSALLESTESYQLNAVVVGAVLYQGLVIAGFGFVTWVYLLQRYSASKLATFQFSVPVFGVILGWLILGEALTWRLGIGVLLVAGGIYAVSTSGRGHGKGRR